MNRHLIIKQESLVSQIINSILDRIGKHDFDRGKKFPTLEELAKEYKVSRATVREAVKNLEMAGLLDVRQGHRTLVVDRSTESLGPRIAKLLSSTHLLAQEVVEIRLALESATALYAAKRRSEKSLDKLTELLNQMKNNKHNIHSFGQYDRNFHLEIAKATGNPLFVLFLQEIGKLHMEVQYITLLRPNATQHAIEFHIAILKALKEGKSETAQHIMSKHIQDILKLISSKE